MPQRSNPFQRIVTAIQSHLSPGAEVTESKMLVDLVSGQPREVDVCIEAQVAGNPIIVSVECRGHGRPQSLGWVEEMHGKHETLPTNLLVLASSSGFTRAASEKAARLKIVTATLGGLDEESFGDYIVNKLDLLFAKRFDMTPTRCEIQVESGEDLLETVVVEWATTVFASDGTELGTVQDIAATLLSDIDLDNAAMRDATGSETHFTVGVDLAVLPLPDSSGGVYVRQTVDDRSVLLKVKQLEVVGTIVVRVAEVPLRHGELQGAGYAHGEVSGLGGSLEVIATETVDGTNRFTGHLTLDA